MSREQPRLPKQCPKCQYDLTGISYERGVAGCPECSLTYQQFVPAMDWPMRCANCKTDLTGEPICAGRVECPKCALVQWSTTLKSGRPNLMRTLVLYLVVLFFIAPAVLFVLFLVIGMIWPLFVPR